MRRGLSSAIGLVGASALIALAGCTTDPSVQPSGEGGGGEEESSQEWFDQELYDTQLAQRDIDPQGPEDKPYLQMIDPEMVDTSQFESEGEKKMCFANASISNPWRQTGWITMNEQLKELKDNGVITEMETRDAQDNDDTQISDIDYFISEGDCDGFIISPNSTAAITPAVERACETDKPVIVFDRGVETDCAVTFIHPIGGFAWGIDSAEFLIDNLSDGDKVVALRILPGVDVLEQRWAAAEKLFDEAGIDVVDHFTEGDPATIKKVVSDELAKSDVQGIWMDAGDGAVSAIEAFEDAGKDYPVMTGEDELSFLRKWDETGMTAIAPVYTNFQWRTPAAGRGDDLRRSGGALRMGPAAGSDHGR
jgi:ribose transport system substrate-binding protein